MALGPAAPLSGGPPADARHASTQRHTHTQMFPTAPNRKQPSPWANGAATGEKDAESTQPCDIHPSFPFITAFTRDQF